MYLIPCGRIRLLHLIWSDLEKFQFCKKKTEILYNENDQFVSPEDPLKKRQINYEPK